MTLNDHTTTTGGNTMTEHLDYECIACGDGPYTYASIDSGGRCPLCVYKSATAAAADAYVANGRQYEYAAAIAAAGRAYYAATGVTA